MRSNSWEVKPYFAGVFRYFAHSYETSFTAFLAFPIPEPKRAGSDEHSPEPLPVIFDEACRGALTPGDRELIFLIESANRIRMYAGAIAKINHRIDDDVKLQGSTAQRANIPLPLRRLLNAHRQSFGRHGCDLKSVAGKNGLHVLINFDFRILDVSGNRILVQFILKFGCRLFQTQNQLDCFRF